MRNPIVLVESMIEYYREGLKSSEVQADPARLEQHHATIHAFEALQASMEIEYFPLGEKTTLAELRPGAVFATKYGVEDVLAVKSAYWHSEEPHQCQCILLSSGEYAHFEQGNQTVVDELILPKE